MSLSNELLNTAPCGFVSFADDGSITLVNQTLLDLLGYRREELIGTHIERILNVGSRIFYQTHWFPLLRLHGRAEEIFLMLRSSGGEEIGALVNAVRREREEGVAYDCVLMRVRERQKYEDELLRARRAAEQAREEAERLRTTAEEANQAKSAFLAVMSHELRTPLNAIAGYVELMDMGIHGPVTDAQRDSLARIARGQRHLLRLINDVLNLARIEAGRVDYDLEDVPLAELADSVIPMIEPQLEQKGLGFSVEVPPDLVARADREKCQQILLNLLGNAVKFTAPGGKVTMDAMTPPDVPDQLLLRVADTGIGIPEDKLDAVFQPFIQVDVTRSHAAEGSGLGLAISRDLARGMHGDLWAESTLGEGSRFTLRLPRAATASSQDE